MWKFYNPALGARANVTQEFPGIIAFGMAIIPVQTNCVSAHGLHFFQLGNRPEDRQRFSVL
jgi:hypothetical protein